MTTQKQRFLLYEIDGKKQANVMWFLLFFVIYDGKLRVLGFGGIFWHFIYIYKPWKWSADELLMKINIIYNCRLVLMR